MSNWYSVVGLTFDLVGFGIIAWDLYSDYGRFSLRRSQKQAVRLWDEAVTEETNDTASDFPELAELRATIAKLTKQVAESNIYLAYLRLTGGRPGDEPDATVAEMADVVRKAAQTPPEQATSRPPIRLAIALVLVGFALQIVGAWPAG